MIEQTLKNWRFFALKWSTLQAQSHMEISGFLFGQFVSVKP